MKTKTLPFLTLLAAGLAAHLALATSTPEGFVDDMEAAKSASAEKKKPVIAVFTGSDWCPYCIKLEKNVFSKPEFARDAPKEFELVFIDNPNKKSLLSPHALKANHELIQEYGIQGYPTVLMLDCFGQSIARLGHGAASPDEFLSAARRERDGNKEKLETAYKIAAMKKGSQKRLSAIADFIKGVDPAKQRNYPAYCEELLAKGSTYKSIVPYYATVKPLEAEVKKIALDIAADFKKVSTKHGMTPAKAKNLTPEKAEALAAKVSDELARSTYPKHLRRAKALLAKVKDAESSLPPAFKEDLEKVRKGAEETARQLEGEIERRKELSHSKGKSKGKSKK